MHVEDAPVKKPNTILGIDEANTLVQYDYSSLALANTAALKTTVISAGTGLTGGGDLSANRSFSIAAATLALINGAAQANSLATVATTGNYSDLNGIPSLANYVTGPASAIVNNIAVFNSTTGKVLKDGGVLDTSPRFPKTIAAVSTATNLNTLVSPGWAGVLTNHPNAPATGIFVLYVIEMTATTAVTQVLYPGTADGKIWTRSLNSGVWSSWSTYASTAQGTKADTAVQTVNGKSGISITLNASDVNAASTAQGTKADTALQPADIGVTVGNMLKSVYDPTNKNASPFLMDNMTEGTSTKIMTAAERTKLSSIATGATVNQTDAYLLTRTNHTGIIPDSGLPTRLTGQTVVLDADPDGWNAATLPGFYTGRANTANAPNAAGSFFGIVTKHQTAGHFRQEVWNATNGTEGYVRFCINTVWGAWKRLHVAEDDLDARYATLSGATFTNGVSFGNATAANTTSLARHIALYSTTYGFNVTSNTLNYVSAGIHDFYGAGAKILSVSASTFQYKGQDIWHAGNFNPSNINAQTLGGQGPSYYQIDLNRVAGIELGTSGSGDRNCYFDFHADDTNTDFSARLRRTPGENGDFTISNKGTGNVNISTDSGNIVLNNATNINGKLTAAAGTTSAASLNLPHGSVPTTPANGDIWTTTGGLYVRANGATGTVWDSRLAADISQAEAEAGTSTTRRMFTAQRVGQAIAALAAAKVHTHVLADITDIGGTANTSTYLRGDGTWATIAAGGTVTSVAASVPTGFTVSGSPITSSGTLAITYSAGYQGYTTAEATKVSNAVLGNVDKTLTAGYSVTSVNDGTKSSGTYTPTPAGGNLKYITNGGAFTLAAPTASGDYTIIIEVINGGSAGAITLSNFTKISGDAFTTTNGHKFLMFITKLNDIVHVTIQALQ